ncbi:MAG: DUF4175 family protein [Bacteroidetes bacterium]|nr:DUF4175 family protein [Bacteroidota bacterium]
MTPDQLKRFIYRAEILRQFRPLAGTFFIFTGLLLSTVYFLDDQLVPVSLRWALFLIFLLSGTGLLSFFLVRIRKRVRLLNSGLKPLALEEILREFSAFPPARRNQFLNSLFLPGSDQELPVPGLRNRTRAENRILFLFGLTLLLVVLSAFFLQTGWHDFFNPSLPSAHLSQMTVSLEPGNTKLERGDTLRIVAQVQNSPSPVNLIIERTGYPAEIISGQNGTPLVWVLPDLQEDVSYSLRNDWYHSETFTVKVTDRPFIARFTLSVKPPAYTSLPSAIHTLKEGNQILVPEGTKLLLTAGASKEISSFFLEGWNRSPVSASGKTLLADRQVFSDFRFRFRILDSDSLENRDSTWFQVSVQPDQAPVLSVQPVSDLTTRDFTIPLKLAAEDDFGVSRVLVTYRIRSVFDLMEPAWKSEQLLALPDPDPVYSGLLNWKIADDTVIPGDIAEFRVGVADNFPFRPGGHITWSDLFTIQTPSTDDSFKRADSLTRTLTDELARIKEESARFNREVEKALEDLKRKNGQLNFSEQQEAAQILGQKKKLTESREDLQKKMDAKFSELNKSQTLAPETLQKYLELQKMIQETGSQEMKELLKRLDDSVNKLDRSQVLDALKNLKLDNDKLKEQIEKGIETVKRLQLEQKFEEFSQKTNQLALDQQDIQAGLQKENPDFPKTELKQQIQTDRLTELAQSLKDLEKKAAELKDKQNLPENQLNKLKDFLEKQNLAQKSAGVQKKIQQKNTAQARQESKELSEKLQEMSKESGDMQQAFKENQNMIILKLLRNLLLKANEWAEIAGSPPPAKDLNKWGASLTDMLLQNHRILVDSASAIATREPQLGILLSHDLEIAGNLLSQAKGFYTENQAGSAEQARTNSRTQINGMIYRILTLMAQKSNQQGQGMQGDQQKSFMDEMRELANQQQGLNQQVLNEQGKPQQQGPSRERLAQMAAQQEAIRQQLQDLMERTEKGQQGSGLGGQLSQVEKEMEKAAKELTQNLDSRVIERQQKILTRMLESQRSTIEREFEEKRESITNKKDLNQADFSLQNPALPPDKLEEIRKGLDQYNQTYQNFIRKYYQERK